MCRQTAASSSGFFFGTIASSLVEDALKIGTPTDLLIGFSVGVGAFNFVDYVIKHHTEKQPENEQPNLGEGTSQKSSWQRAGA